MSTLIESPPAKRKPVELASGTPLFPISVVQYHETIAKGILSTNDPVELLNGLLLRKVVQNAPHARMIRRLTIFLPTVLPEGWMAQLQLPVVLGQSEPERDAAILRGSAYDQRHPTAIGHSIVIEVADTTLRYDRSEKGPIYAAAGIAEYWIISLEASSVEVYSQPSSDEYLQMQVYRSGELVPLVMDGQLVTTVSVKDLFAAKGE